MRAILYAVQIDDRTSRFFDATTPEIPVIRSAFPGLGAEKTKITTTSLIYDGPIEALWARTLRDRPKETIQIYGGNDEDVVPPAFAAACREAESELDRLNLAKIAAPASQAAKAEAEAATEVAEDSEPEPAPAKPGRARKPAFE
jgi:hypothetical protein